MHHEHNTDERDPLTGQPWGSEQKIETKEFFRTSEFGVLAVVGLGILIAAGVTVTIDALSAAQLVAFLAFAYIISRGLAKSGVSHPYAGRQRLDLRERFSEKPRQQAYPPQPSYPQAGYTPHPQPPAQPTEPVPQPAQQPQGAIRQPSPQEGHPAGGQSPPVPPR